MVIGTKVLLFLKLLKYSNIKAAALGCNMEFVGTSEKVMNGKVIKECTEEAIRLNPNDGSAHYILGRFYSELLKVFLYLKIFK